MSYSYSTPLSYGTQQPASYDYQPDYQYNPEPQEIQDTTPKTKRSWPYGVGGALIGATGGSIIASKKNPYMKNGIPTDTFSRMAYNKYADKYASEAVKKSYGQYNEVIKKIDKVKTTDELKTLLNNNPEASKEVSTALNKTTEEFLSTVTDTNLASNKETIKKKLESANQTRYQNMKNDIARCWDTENKKFVKPDGMEDGIFDAIKKTTGRVKANFIAKYAAISALVVGAVAYLAHKIITIKKQNSQQ